MSTRRSLLCQQEDGSYQTDTRRLHVGDEEDDQLRQGKFKTQNSNDALKVKCQNTGTHYEQVSVQSPCYSWRVVFPKDGSKAAFVKVKWEAENNKYYLAKLQKKSKNGFLNIKYVGRHVAELPDAINLDVARRISTANIFKGSPRRLMAYFPMCLPPGLEHLTGRLPPTITHPQKLFDDWFFEVYSPDSWCESDVPEVHMWRKETDTVYRPDETNFLIMEKKSKSGDPDDWMSFEKDEILNVEIARKALERLREMFYHEDYSSIFSPVNQNFSSNPDYLKHQSNKTRD